MFFQSAVITSGKMDDKWFKQQQKRAGVTAGDIAARMGRARSNISNIYSGNQRMSLDWAKVFAEMLNQPLDEVLRRAGVLDDSGASAAPLGFREGDAVPWQGRGGADEKITNAAKFFGGGRPGVDIWTVRSTAMALGGYLPGDQMLVDTHQSERCRAGDVVIAQVYNRHTAETVLRRYEPPVLVAASGDPAEGRVLVVDGANVVIRGKVVASWRS